MATIKKIETSRGTRWRLRLYVGRDGTTGKRRFVIQTFERKKDADAAAAKLATMKHQGTLTPPSKAPLAKYLRSWLNDVMKGRVRERTWHSYDSILRRHIESPAPGAPPIGAIRMDKLTPEGIQQLYGWAMHDPDGPALSPATIRRIHAVLRQGLQYATKNGAIGRNHADLVDLPKLTRREVVAMSADEARGFLEAAKSDHLYALCAILLTCGLRPSEGLALKWKDADLVGGKLHVHRTLVKQGITAAPGWKLLEPKTAKGRRVVSLPPFVVHALKEHRKAVAAERLAAGKDYENHDFIFCSKYGRPLDVLNLNARIRDVVDGGA